jgi:non-heme chloroperoxidase
MFSSPLVRHFLLDRRVQVRKGLHAFFFVDLDVTAGTNVRAPLQTERSMSTSRRTFFAAAGVAAAAISKPAQASAARTARPVRGHGGFVRVADGTELFVRDWGRGRPVVLTHAWPMSADCWDQHAVDLVDAGYRVITYDRRGFGRSTQPGDGYDYDTFTDDLAAVIAATGVRDAALAGFSMGGGEVVRYFSRHGGRNVARAVLVASVVPGLARGPNNPEGMDPGFFEAFKENLRRDRLGFLAALLRDVFYDLGAKGTTPVTQAVVDWTLAQGMQASLLALLRSIDAFAREDFSADLPAVNVPTLILHGDADKPVPIALTARRAARGIREARLIEYAGATHGILVSERERVTRDLMAFLADGGGRS